MKVYHNAFLQITSRKHHAYFPCSHECCGYIDLEDGWAGKRAKDVKDTLSVSIEQNWVIEKSKEYGKCLQKLSVSINSRKRSHGAKIVMLALWGKDSVCAWVRVMVTAEKHLQYGTTATKSSMTDSECPRYILLLKNCLRQRLDFFCPQLESKPHTEWTVFNPVCSKCNLKRTLKSSIVSLKRKLRWRP